MRMSIKLLLAAALVLAAAGTAKAQGFITSETQSLCPDSINLHKRDTHTRVNG